MFCKGTDIQDENLYALQEECKSYKGLELDGIHIRVGYNLLVVSLFRQAAPLPDMSCTNPDQPSRPALQGWGLVGHFSSLLLSVICFAPSYRHYWPVSKVCGHAETVMDLSFPELPPVPSPFLFLVELVDLVAVLPIHSKVSLELPR